MGCDIHMYVEYTNKERRKELESKGEQAYWMPFGDRFNPGRNYVLFGYLAGVRDENKHSLTPKGIPEDLGYSSMTDNRLYITEDGKGDNETTLENALRWNKDYGCKLYNDREGKPTCVDHPDWHSHSWLTLKEYSKVMKLYLKDPNNWGGAIEYHALLSVMKTLEKGGFYETRIVFWFDN